MHPGRASAAASAVVSPSDRMPDLAVEGGENAGKNVGKGGKNLGKWKKCGKTREKPGKTMGKRQSLELDEGFNEKNRL